MNNVPIAGDDFEVVDSLEAARERAKSCAESLRNERISAKAGDGKVTLSSLASAVSSGKLSGLDLHQLNVILKVDLQVCITTTHVSGIWKRAACSCCKCGTTCVVEFIDDFLLVLCCN